MPAGWLNITTHRLDIYDEKLIAKNRVLRSSLKPCLTILIENYSAMKTHSLRPYLVRPSLSCNFRMVIA
jgi:hypothetical protein